MANAPSIECPKYDHDIIEHHQDILEHPKNVMSSLDKEHAALVTEMMNKIPDLMLYIHPKSGISFCSMQLAPQMSDMVVSKHEIDAGRNAYYAWPYTVVDGHIVYSVPPLIKIGETNTSGFGIVPSSTWTEEADKACLGYKVVRAIKEWLGARPPISYR
jgi:hypothetical protein